MVAILYTQADVNQYTSQDFKASADRMGNGLLAKHDSTGPPKEPAVYSARSGKLLDFSLNRERPAHSAHEQLLHGICIYFSVSWSARLQSASTCREGRRLFQCWPLIKWCRGRLGDAYLFADVSGRGHMHVGLLPATMYPRTR